VRELGRLQVVEPQDQFGGAAAGSQQINPQPVSDLKQAAPSRIGIQQWISQWNYYQVDGTER